MQEQHRLSGDPRPLTTIRQPLAEMGTVAARTVLRMLAGEEVESPRVELATELVVRHSTAPHRESGRTGPVS